MLWLNIFGGLVVRIFSVCFMWFLLWKFGVSILMCVFGDVVWIVLM